MKRIFYFMVILFAGINAFAQQQAVYSNFLMNKYYYNPAIAGSKPHHIVNLGVRKQWTGFKGSPFLIHANFHGSYKNRGKVGYGASIISENMGITNRFGIYVNYAQHFKLFKKVKLGLGVRPGYVQYSAKLYKAQLADKGDATLTGNTYSGGAFDINLGFNLYSPTFFVMASFNHILGKAFRFAPYNANLAAHFNAIIGYNIRFKKKKFTLQPSLMLKYVKPAPAQLCAMLKGTYDDKYWVGIIFRTNDAIGISIGAKIKKQFCVSYGYDYTIGKFRKYQFGSHEIMLSYIINGHKKSLQDKDEELNNSIMEMNKKRMNK